MKFATSDFGHFSNMLTAARNIGFLGAGEKRTPYFMRTHPVHRLCYLISSCSAMKNGTIPTTGAP